MGFTKVLSRLRSRRDMASDGVEPVGETVAVVLESHNHFTGDTGKNASPPELPSHPPPRRHFSLDHVGSLPPTAPVKSYSVARTLQSFKSLVRKPSLSARSTTAAARFEEDGLASSHIVSQAKKQFLANNQKEFIRAEKDRGNNSSPVSSVRGIHHHRTSTSTSMESTSRKTGLKRSRLLLKSFRNRFVGRTMDVSYDGMDVAAHYVPDLKSDFDKGSDDAPIEGPQMEIMNRMLTQVKADEAFVRSEALTEMKGLVHHRWVQQLFWEEAIPADIVCLVELLDTSSLSTASNTAHVLRGLTSSSKANLDILGETGAVDRLLALLLRAVQKDDDQLASAVSDTLAQMVGHSANNQRLMAQAPQLKQLIVSMEQGRGPCKASVSALVHLLAYFMAINPASLHGRMDRQLLRSMMAVVDINKNNKAVYDALSVIGLLVMDNPEAQHMLRELRGLESLLKLTQDRRLVDTSASDRAAWVLMQAVRGSKQNLGAVRELTMTYGWASLVIPAVVSRLDVNKTRSVVNTALGLLTALSENEDLLKSTVKFGVVQKLQMLVLDSLARNEMSMLDACLLMLQSMCAASSVARNKVIQVGVVDHLLKVIEIRPSALSVERALWVLCALAQDTAGQDCLLHSSGLPILVNAIQNSGGATEGPVPAALMTLLQISEGKQSNQEALRHAGAVPALLTLTRSMPSRDEDRMVAEAAVGVLVNMAHNSASTQTAMFIHGAIPAMLELAACDSSDSVLPVLAVAVLKAMAEGNEQYKIAIREGGGIDLLLGLLERGGEQERLEVAADTLLALVSECSSNLVFLCTTGGMARIVSLLNQGAWSDVTERVLTLMTQLAKGNADVQDKVRSSGGVEMLLGLLKVGGSHPIAPLTAKALEELVKGNKALQDYVAASGGVAVLVKLMEGGPASAAAASSASALAALVDNNYDNQERSRECGAISALLDLLAAGPTTAVATAVLTAVKALAANNLNNTGVMRDQGVVARLLHHLDPAASVDLTVLALQCLSLMCALLPQIREDVGRDGGIPKLVSCISTGSDESTMARTAAACNALCCSCVDSTSNKHDARGAGAIPLLCLLLNVGRNESSGLEAAFALSALVADNPTNQDAVREAGGISRLVHLAAAGSRSSIAWVCAMCLLDCCRGNAHIQDAVRSANGIPVVIDLLCASTNDDTSEMLLQMLSCLAEGNDTNSQAIYESGVLGLVADRMQHASPAVARWSAHMFEKLSRSYAPVQEMVRECGILDLSVSLLKHSRDDNLVISLLDLCTALALNNELNAWMLCERGALDIAVNFMKSGPDQPICQSGVKLMAALSSYTQLRSREVSRAPWVTTTLAAAVKSWQELPEQVVEDAVDCVGNMAPGCATLLVRSGLVVQLVGLWHGCCDSSGQPLPQRLKLQAATMKTLFTLAHCHNRAGCQLAAAGGSALFIRVHMIPIALALCTSPGHSQSSSGALLVALSTTLLIALVANTLKPAVPQSAPSTPSSDMIGTNLRGGVRPLPQIPRSPFKSSYYAAAHDVYVWS